MKNFPSMKQRQTLTQIYLFFSTISLKHFYLLNYPFSNLIIINYQTFYFIQIYIINENNQILIQENNKNKTMKNGYDVQPCSSVKYVDCRSWYDFTQHLLAILGASILSYRVISHYRNLKHQKEDKVTEHQKSIRRKIRVNLIQIIYLASFIISTILSIYLFFPYQSNKQQLNVTQPPIIFYRLSEIWFINCLNILNLYVGYLYWKATRAYYVISRLEEPVLYKKLFKLLFLLFFCLNISAVIIGAVDLWRGLQIVDFKLLTLIATVLSITACFVCRVLYRKYILKKINLSQRAIWKQTILSILLFTSSFLRIFLYSFDIIYYHITHKQWQSITRNQHPINQDRGCLDASPIYAIIMVSIDLLVNLMPALIYGHLFVSEISTKYKKSKEKQEKLLRKNSEKDVITSN